MRQDRSCGPKILVQQHFTNKHRNPMFSGTASADGCPRVADFVACGPG